MKRLTLSEGTNGLFRRAGDELELCAASGQVLGHFVPAEATKAGDPNSPGGTRSSENGEPTRVLLDAALRTRLGGLTDSLEFLDGAGHVLGYFLPVQDRTIYEGVDSPTDPEELRRRAAEPGGRTWAEIRADLEKIA